MVIWYLLRSAEPKFVWGPGMKLKVNYSGNIRRWRTIGMGWPILASFVWWVSGLQSESTFFPCDRQDVTWTRPVWRQSTWKKMMLCSLVMSFLRAGLCLLAFLWLVIVKHGALTLWVISERANEWSGWCIRFSLGFSKKHPWTCRDTSGLSCHLSDYKCHQHLQTVVWDDP